MKEINEQEFKTLVEKSKGVVLVDFFATWCGPCRMLAPILEQVEKSSEIEIYKVDVDECPELAKSFSIMTVPTMIIFQDGVMAEKLNGLMPKDKICELVDEYKKIKR